MRRAILVILMLASLLTACGLGDSPEKAAQEWVQAFANLDGNKIAERTCAAQQENVQQAGLWASAFNLFGQQTIGQQTKTDVSGLKFSTVSSSGDTANVRVTGQIHVAVMALSQTQDVNETWQMVQEGGKWKWCGKSGNASVDMSSPTKAPAIVPQAPGSPVVVEVRADSAWQDTGFSVRAGDIVAITYVSGLWCLNTGFCLDGRGCLPGKVDPNVCPTDPGHTSNIFYFAHAALIGSVDYGEIFGVGNGVTYKAEQAGNIRLRINSKRIEGNSGALTVRLEIVR